MKPKRFGRTRAVGHGSVIALLTAALVFFGVTRVVNRPDTRLGKVLLTAVNDFGISSTISSSAVTKTAPMNLYPGTDRYFWYTVSNPLSQPITVTSISIPAGGVIAPAGCAASNLDLTHTTFSGSLLVPKKVGLVNGTASVEVGIIKLIDDPLNNQQGCKSKTFNFTYTGTGTYTEVYNTSTAVASSLNPSVVGQSVTYTASVTGIQGAGQDPVPSSPTGTVTFKDGATTICSAVPVVSFSTTVAKATCTPPAYLVSGSHTITAAFTHDATAGNFNDSNGSLPTQTVNPSNSTTVLASAPNPSLFGQSVSLTATVTPTSGPASTGTVSFYAGTSPTGTLSGTATLSGNPAKATFVTAALPGGSDPLYAVYGGNLSDSPSMSVGITQTVNFTTACLTTTVNGGYTVHTGQSICFSSPGRVNGGITVQSGGALTLNSGVTVNGGVNATDATALRVCGSTINGAVSASGATGFVMMGDGSDDGLPGCAVNTINGGVSVTNGHGGFEVGGNHVNGTMTFSGNTGTGPTTEDAAPEVEGNSGNGGLTCATSNSPAITDGGYTNTINGTKSGQCAGAGF